MLPRASEVITDKIYFVTSKFCWRLDMAAPAPLYNRGDILYLAESAAIGFLEPVTISGITMAANGAWLYSYVQGVKLQRSGTYGDRRSLVNGLVIWLDESELTDYYSALTLARQSVTNRLNEINILLESAPSP